MKRPSVFLWNGGSCMSTIVLTISLINISFVGRGIPSIRLEQIFCFYSHRHTVETRYFEPSGETKKV